MATMISGLSLGQADDPSAFVIAEISRIPDPQRPDCSLNSYSIRHIYRWDLAPKFTQIVQDLKGWYDLKPQLPGSTLLVDVTGVGKPVADIIRQSSIQATIKAYSITSGMNEGPYDDGHGTVPKLHLCGRTQTAVQQRRVKYAENLALGPVLEREMTTFQVKVTPDKNESFASWREKDQDDILLSLAMVIWYAEKHCKGDGGWLGPTTTIREQVDAWKRPN